MSSLSLGGISSSLRLISFSAVGENVRSRCGESAADVPRQKPRNTSRPRRASTRSLFFFFSEGTRTVGREGWKVEKRGQAGNRGVGLKLQNQIKKLKTNQVLTFGELQFNRW